MAGLCAWIYFDIPLFLPFQIQPFHTTPDIIKDTFKVAFFLTYSASSHEFSRNEKIKIALTTFQSELPSKHQGDVIHDDQSNFQRIGIDNL